VKDMVKSEGGTLAPTRTVWAVRFVLGAVGLGLMGYGAMGFPTQLGPSQLLGLLVWMAAAILIHDGLIVPLSTLAGFGLRRSGSRLRPASAAVMRGSLMAGAVVTLIVGVLLKAQTVARSTSALEGDYAINLMWFWAVLLTVASALIYTIERRYRRGSSRGTSR